VSVVEAFQTHVGSVERLMNFDRDVMDFAIKAIEELRDQLVPALGLLSP